MPTRFDHSSQPLLPSPIGQDTGQSPERKNQEAVQLLRMLDGMEDREDVLSGWELNFLRDTWAKYRRQGKHVQFTGKEVMKLREIKDKLVEKGAI